MRSRIALLDKPPIRPDVTAFEQFEAHEMRVNTDASRYPLAGVDCLLEIVF